MFKRKNRTKKGFLLTDAFLGIVIAVIVGITCTAIIVMITKSINVQMENNDTYAIASSILEEIKSSNTSIETDPSVSNTTTIVTNPVGKMYTYNATVKIEKDSYNEDFRVITVTLKWKDKRGIDRTYELKGFKAVGI